TEKLSSNFSGVKNLKVNLPAGMNLNYIVDESAPTIKQRIHKDARGIDVVVEGGSATISLSEYRHRFSGEGASVTVHGPALEDFSVINGYASYNAGVQAKLIVSARNDASLSLADSY